MELLDAKKHGIKAKLAGLGISLELNQGFVNQVFDDEMSKERRSKLFEAYRYGWTIADLASSEVTNNKDEKLPYLVEFNKLKKIIDNESKPVTLSYPLDDIKYLKRQYK